MRSIKLGVFHWRLAAIVPLVLVVAGCGSRSGLSCLGESCRPALGGTAGDGFGDEPGGFGGEPSGGPATSGTGNGARPALEPSPPPPSVGPDEPPPFGRAESSCAIEGSFGASILIQTPADLERLEGCREVAGDLLIQGLFVDDLSELRELRRVTGTLQLMMSGSLDGLESLEAVGNLLLESLDVPTLAPLRGLRQIGDQGNETGTLAITGLAQTRDLTGLASIESLRALEIYNAGSLTSLAGLSLPSKMVSVQLVNNPALVDLSALSALTEVDNLGVVTMNNTTLRGLENLRVAGALNLVDLRALTDLQALGNLRVVGALQLVDLGINDLAGLEELERADSINIQSNRLLAEVDSLGLLISLEALIVVDNPLLLRLPELGVDRLSLLMVANNEQLEAGPGFPRVISLEALSITTNPALTAVDGFSNLQVAGDIRIEANAALTQLNLEKLGGARAIRITCNGALPESTLEPLRSLGGDVSIYGNQDSVTPCENTP